MSSKQPAKGKQMLRMVLTMFLLMLSCQAATARPLLFLYPIPYRFSDGQTLDSPQTMTVAQITRKMPELRIADGVVLMVYWSTLCPEPGRCNFSLINQTIRYWGLKHKQVVLDVVTIGFPIWGPSGVETATPRWVLSQVRTYQWKTRLLGKHGQSIMATMPDFTDNRFLVDIQDLLKGLHQFDGNKSLSQIRIATGLMGEDNPLIGPMMKSAAGFSEQSWLEYCEKLTVLYYKEFPHTQLEFDIGRLSWMAALGSTKDRSSIEEFLQSLLIHHVMLAFDGLSSESLMQLRRDNPKSGVGQSLRYLQNYQARGGEIGLEAMRHASAPAMKDYHAIAEVIRIMKPNRLVLFADKGEKAKSFDRLTASLGY